MGITRLSLKIRFAVAVGIPTGPVSCGMFGHGDPFAFAVVEQIKLGALAERRLRGVLAISMPIL